MQAVRKLQAEAKPSKWPRADRILYDQAPTGWDVEALKEDFIGREPPLPRCGTEEDIPF